MLHFTKSDTNEKRKDTTIPKTYTPDTVAENQITTVAEVHSQPILACQDLSNKSYTLLSTVQLYVFDSSGNKHLIKGILDNGSQQDLITKRFASKLNLDTKPVRMNIAGVGSAPVRINDSIRIKTKSVNNNYRLHLDSLVIDYITNKIPTTRIDVSQLKIPHGLPLADKQFFEPADIDLLIGGSHFWNLLCGEQIDLGVKAPVLQKTKLGYLVTGVIYQNNHHDRNVSAINLCMADNMLHERVSKFFELDKTQPSDPSYLLSEEEKYCEKYFEKTTTRDETGRFVVSIPFNENVSKLGGSYATALRRFNALEKRFEKNQEIKTLYSEFMSEYSNLKHMTLLPEVKRDSVRYFLPHFEVLRENALTTKIRVVFDGGTKTDTGVSINDCQFLGHVIQDTLFSILLRFRGYPIAIVADCEKMYRQISINPEDRKYQCILWRNHATEQLQTYCLNTVTYGLKSSSYLATKCLQHLAVSNSPRFPEASRVIQKQMYMDDLLAGGNSVTDVIRLREQVTKILSQAGIPLRKFLSNALDALPRENQGKVECFTVPIQELGSAKALGVKWDPNTDTIRYEFSLDSSHLRITKRSILSVVSKLFDPLGLTAPLIITGKILIQRLWQEKYDWDSELPAKLQKDFIALMKEFSEVHSISIPSLFSLNDPIRIELHDHGFSDASESAFGAVLYVRCVYSEKVNVTILCSKSRVSPLKSTVTIPRLELSACVLLAELHSKARNSLTIKFDEIYLWSDSQIALQWINSAPNKFKIFIANRIATINQLTEKRMWNYVPTNDNPADCISRGITVSGLHPNGLWVSGPAFLYKNEQKWPKQVTYNKNELLLPEVKTSVTLLLTNPENYTLDSIINKFSSFAKIIRVTAFLKRFGFNARNQKADRKINGLSPEDLNNALMTIIKHVQLTCFSEELRELRLKKDNKRNKLFSNLNAFLDNNDIVRVGGRLNASNLRYDTIHPMILPKRHRLTLLIVEHYHKKFLHCGPNQLLAAIREKFWLLAGRNICKSVVHKCVTCFKFSPTVCDAPTGNLPQQRIQALTACFENTGCDFTGFFLIKNSYARNATLIKAYICLFICQVTKAIHLELVTSLSSEAFIEAFKRFIARRGKPRNVYSDNCTNFVGAASTLKELYDAYKNQNFQKVITEYTSAQGINWQFIPPRSPHFGGIWESNIRRTKAHLYKILKDTKLTYESFTTVLFQIEYVLNSRPLSPLSNDPNDPRPLTPFHFILGKASEALAEPSLEEVPYNRLGQFQLRQRLVEHFWKRWSKEVLLEYQRLAKTSSDANRPLQVGDLVLLSDDNAPTLQWPLGRVVNVHPGIDQVVRVASVRLQSGNVTKRAVKKLCVLPLS